jgi:hypothetical protein
MVDMIEVCLGDSWTGDGGVARDEDCCSGAPRINYSEDGIIPLVRWEASDKIHGHNLEWFCVWVGAYSV